MVGGPPMHCDLSIVIPVCNEASNIDELATRLTKTLEPLELEYEIIFVDDGSTDESLALILALRSLDERVKAVEFSRNFGHQVAVTAGLDHAAGDAVVVMDGDLQDPPEVLPQLIEGWRGGAQVVYGVRRQRKENSLLRAAYAGFYRLLSSISEVELPLDSGDFALMDRRVVDLLRTLPERNRYVRGLRAWVGFRQESVEYERGARHRGQTKYEWRELFRLALDGIFSFSEAPLHLMRNAGLLISLGAALIAGWTLIKRLIWYEVVPGFATLALLVLFFGGVQLVTVGILGEYVARIYTEVKGRHRYVVGGLHGVAPSADRHGLPPQPLRGRDGEQDPGRTRP